MDEINKSSVQVRKAETGEFARVGELLVQVYSQLEGFPKPSDQPGYYDLLANVGELTYNAGTELLVAVTSENQIVGAVVYIGDMTYYGSGGIATQQIRSAGFRLLAVHPEARSQGIGQKLTWECIRKAEAQQAQDLIIHTTTAMQTAWKMYEKIGFKRSEDLDFMQGSLPVFGFRR
jgi:ribosomal protein S18 acetylase RimI-like enzyme